MQLYRLWMPHMGSYFFSDERCLPVRGSEYQQAACPACTYAPRKSVKDIMRVDKSRASVWDVRTGARDAEAGGNHKRKFRMQWLSPKSDFSTRDQNIWEFLSFSLTAEVTFSLLFPDICTLWEPCCACVWAFLWRLT